MTYTLTPKKDSIVIQNLTEIDIESVLTLVAIVIKQGRISKNGKSYCYLTSFNIEGQDYDLVCDLKRDSDVFTFYKS